MKGIFRQVDTKRTIDILCIRKKTLALHVSNSISIEMYSEWENNGIIMGRFQLKLWPISPLKGQSKLNSPDRLFPLYWLNLLLISIDRSGHWLTAQHYGARFQESVCGGGQETHFEQCEWFGLPRRATGCHGTKW